MTIAAVDRLVIQDDATAARLWPKLGPKVRDAYLADRDSWVAIRRKSDAGSPPSAGELAAKHRAFAGWARAFRVAGRAPKHSATARPTARAATPAASVPPATGPSRPAKSVTSAPALHAAALATSATLKAPTASHGAAGAVAGGLVLAGLIAFAARRKRA